MGVNDEPGHPGNWPSEPERISDSDAVRRLQELTVEDGDSEYAHAEADAVLIEYLRSLGHHGVADAWVECRDRVGFWYA